MATPTISPTLKFSELSLLAFAAAKEESGESKTLGAKRVPVYNVGATVGLEVVADTLVGDVMELDEVDGALDGDAVGTLVGATVVKVATWSAEICPVTSP